jgi:hypothetical protein
VAGTDAGPTGGQNMRTRYRKILFAATTALASMAIVASAADAAKPAAPYEDFAGCQNYNENEAAGFCTKVTFSGGHLTLGKRNIPITAPIVLRGNLEQGTGDFKFNSEGGIVPVRQSVEGGLIGSTGNKKLDEEIAKVKALSVYATIELAGQPGQFEEFPFTVPIKVHLENRFLGSACYIGSTASPIVLNLTTGTTNPPAPTAPLTGTPAGPFEEEASRPAVRVQSGGVLVDNTFSVPGANGCQLNVGSHHLNIDSLVNSTWGLPAAAGKSQAVFNYGVQIVSPEVVYP